MAIDVAQLVKDIENVVSQQLGKDVTTLKSFSERQVKAIAQHAALVEAGILKGEITEETRDYFLDSLEDMARNFVKTLRDLTIVMIEKVLNAVVGVIWKAIESGIGMALPRRA